MCIAVLQTPGSTISDRHLKNCFDNNPDGCGFAYIQTDHIERTRLKVYKTMDYDTFLRKYKRALSNNLDSPFLIHFRVATHGTVDTFNCHPFFINKEVAFIHNGIIGGVGTDPIKSDTQMFNDKVLKKLPKDFYKREEYKLLIEKFITGSKLLTLDINGYVTIFNEASGQWKDGVWFSNTSYSYAKTVTSFTYKGQGAKTYYPVTKFQEKKSGLEFFYCDGCQMRHNSNDCRFFSVQGEAKVFCDSCREVALANDFLSISDTISKHRYEIEVAQEEYYYQGERYCG